MLDFDVSLQVTLALDGHATHRTRHAQVSPGVLQHVFRQDFSPGEGTRAQVTHVWPKVGQVVTLENGSLGKALAAYWTHKWPPINCWGFLLQGQTWANENVTRTRQLQCKFFSNYQGVLF